MAMERGITRPEVLLQRLDAIGKSVAGTGKALALIGLGSVGVERERLDEYSDLDFFVIAKDGCKAWFIEDLTWLNSVHPVGYHFRNTPDGYKAFFEDEVYCEFAVFETQELESIPFAEGKIVWKSPEFEEGATRPRQAANAPHPNPAEWLVGEALTCLYVGLCRYQRGEKLSAFRFVQVYAVDRIVELAAHLEQESPHARDQFSIERRFEQRFPGTAGAIAPFMPGYEATPQAALAILEYLDRLFPIHPYLRAAILKRCRQ